MHGREVCSKFQSKNRKRRYHLENLGVDGRILLKCTLEKQGRIKWNGFIWFRIYADGRIL
jgi:hypothetical protein